MGKCININSPEFKELVDFTNRNPIELAADISLWQDKNNTDDFPTAREIDLETNVTNDLNILLENSLSKYNITTERIKEVKDAHGNNTIAVADMFNKMIYISKGKEKASTLPEEAAHFFFEMLNGTNLQTRLLNLLKQDEYYKSILDKDFEKYNKLYEGDVTKLAKEAAGKLLGQSFIRNYKREDVTPVTESLLQRVWNYIINLFKNQIAKTPLQSEIEVLFEELGVNILEDKDIGLNVANIKSKDKYYQAAEKKLKGHEKVAENIKMALARRIGLLQRKNAEKSITEAENARARTLMDLYNDAKYSEGNTTYVKNLLEEATGLQTRIDKLNKLSVDDYTKNVKETADLLRRSKDYYDINMPILSDLEITLRKDIKSVENEEIKAANQATLNIIRELQSDLGELISDYYDASNTLLTNVFKPFLGSRNNERLIQELNKRLPKKKQLSKVDLETLFTETSKDIGIVSRFVDALAETDDTALQLIDLMVKEAKYKARQQSLEDSQLLVDAQRNLGSNDTSFVLAKDNKGNNTGEFVVERDWTTLDAEIKKAMEVFKDRESSEARSKRFEIYKKYAVDQLEVNALLEIKQKELSKEDYDRWYYFNIRERSRFDPKVGGVVVWKTIPKAISKQYQAIQSNKKQKAYYDTVMKMKYRKDLPLPHKVRQPRLAPQIMEKSIDRLKNLKSKEDLKALGSQVKDLFNVMQDEDERGVKFELAGPDGEEIKFVPVYYTKRLKDPKLVSQDITMSMSVYAGMSNNFNEMNKIVDTLEIAKDLIDNRDIIQRDPSGNILMESLKLLGDKIRKPVTKKDSKGSNIAERLNTYYDMMVYGRMKKDEGTVMGFDVAKVLDNLGVYTALNQLSLNLLAGTANILNGKAMERIDAIAGEFFDYKSLLWADKTYGKEITGLVQDIGKYDSSNKLRLWSKHKDVLQHFDSQLRGLDTNRKTRFGRLFDTSALMFVQESGEHYLQTRTSLALANEYRWDGKNFVWKKDYYKAVEDLKYQMRQELSKEGVDAKKVTKEYKAKIKEKTEQLDTNWDKLTNYYDAHKVKNNRLVLSDKYKQASKDDFKFTNKQNFLNKRMHGIYNDSDKNVIQQYALGRLGLLFRKWMVPAFNRRYKGMMFNQEADTFVEGYYVTFFRTLYQDLKQGQYSYTKNWNKLTDVEKANFRRAVSEIGHLLFYIAMAALMSSLDDAIEEYKDDKDFEEKLVQILEYFARRMKTELSWAFDPRELLRIAQTPSAATTPMQNLLNFIQFWDWTDEMKSGRYKGWTKFEKDLFKLLPATKPIHNIFFLEESTKFYTQN